MNYDHAFHAGSFSDVLKHSVFAACLQAFHNKDTSFRVIDAFAGTGRYDLTSDAAIRCPEWQAGIAQFMQAEIPADLRDFFAPYLSAISRSNLGAELRFYPGSPEIARHLTRKQDRITLLEANPKMAPLLNKAMQNDRRVSILEADAWKATLGLLPPPEKRGIVLIDPPFETPNELERLMALMGQISRKWYAGTIIAWLPLKTQAEEQFVINSVNGHAATYGKRPETIYLKLQPSPYHAGIGALPASALVIFNPPWALSQQAKNAVEFMANAIGDNCQSSTLIWPVV